MELKRLEIKKRIFILFLLAVALLPLVSAQNTVTTHSVTYEIISNTEVLVTHNIIFEDILTEDEVISIPRDAKNLKLSGQDTELGTTFEKGVLKIPKGVKQVTITYESKEFLQRSATNNIFVVNFDILQKTQNLDFTVILPSRAILSSEQADSVFPVPTQISTDGQKISVNWQKNNFSTGQNLAFIVFFSAQSNIALIIIISVLLTAIIGISLFFVLRSKLRKKTKKKPTQQSKPKESPNYQKHLKEDEKEIVRILKQKGGSCQQSTLVVISGFSKANLSRILTELEQRNIIKKQPKGNKNIIILSDELDKNPEIID